MRSVLSVRNVLSFLYGFLLGSPNDSLLAGINAETITEDEMMATLRRQSYEDVVRAYQRYHDDGGKLRQTVSLTPLGSSHRSMRPRVHGALPPSIPVVIALL